MRYYLTYMFRGGAHTTLENKLIMMKYHEFFDSMSKITKFLVDLDSRLREMHKNKTDKINYDYNHQFIYAQILYIQHSLLQIRLIPQHISKLINEKKINDNKLLESLTKFANKYYDICSDKEYIDMYDNHDHTLGMMSIIICFFLNKYKDDNNVQGESKGDKAEVTDIINIVDNMTSILDHYPLLNDNNNSITKIDLIPNKSKSEQIKPEIIETIKSNLLNFMNNKTSIKEYETFMNRYTKEEMQGGGGFLKVKFVNYIDMIFSLSLKKKV